MNYLTITVNSLNSPLILREIIILILSIQERFYVKENN